MFIAHVKIWAYGEQVLDEKVNLCSNVAELCPVNKGLVRTGGVHSVPAKYTRSILQAAYLVPDLEGVVQVQLLNASDLAQNMGCFTSDITNGKSVQVAAVTYTTAALAAAALIMSCIASAANAGTSAASGPANTGAGGGGHGGEAERAAPSGPGTNVAAPGWHPPGFTEFLCVLQGISTSGMYTLAYPTAYRSFTQNVAWSMGIISWGGLQRSIDNFRKHTGGNMTENSYARLKETTLVFRNAQNANSSNIEIPSMPDDTNRTTAVLAKALRQGVKRAPEALLQPAMEGESGDVKKKYVTIVTGIRAYVEKLAVPNTNTFMTLLIWWAVVVASCIAAILACKLLLELLSMRGWNRKNKFGGFRQRYWSFMATTLLRLTCIFYGVWVLYCFYQFKLSDSWGAQLLAGILFSVMTLVLVCFSVRVWVLARRAMRETGGLELLFEHEPWLRKYGLFYDQFKISYWWMFVPCLLASFGRSAFIALGSGNGIVQVVGQLAIDIALAGLFIWTMPFNTRMGNIINLAIQIVRVISLALLLCFAVQFKLRGITATGIGLALIVVQSLMTVLLIVLILMNAGFGIFHMTCSGRRQKENQGLQVLESATTGSSVYESGVGIEDPFTGIDEKLEARTHSEENEEDVDDEGSGAPTIKPTAVLPKSVLSSLTVVQTNVVPMGTAAKTSFERPTSVVDQIRDSQQRLSAFSEDNTSFVSALEAASLISPRATAFSTLVGPHTTPTTVTPETSPVPTTPTTPTTVVASGGFPPATPTTPSGTINFSRPTSQQLRTHKSGSSSSSSWNTSAGRSFSGEGHHLYGDVYLGSP